MNEIKTEDLIMEDLEEITFWKKHTFLFIAYSKESSVKTNDVVEFAEKCFKKDWDDVTELIDGWLQEGILYESKYLYLTEYGKKLFNEWEKKMNNPSLWGDIK